MKKLKHTMKHLTYEDILAIHDSVITNTSVKPMFGVRDFNMVHSAANGYNVTIFGNELYPTIEDKAAYLCNSILKNHPFTDGNKRTAVICMITLLELNNKSIKLYTSDYAFFERIASEKYDGLLKLTEFVKEHSYIKPKTKIEKIKFKLKEMFGWR